MSRKPSAIAAVLEWSPSGVRAWTHEGASVQEFPTIADAAQALSLKGRHAGIAIGRRQVFLKAMKLPNAPKEEAMTVLRLQLDQAFPIPAQDLALDFCFVGEATPDGRQAVVAAMRADVLRGLLAEASQAGIKAEWIAPSAFGSQIIARRRRLTDAIVMEATDEGLALDVIQNGCLAASRAAGSRAAAIDVPAEAARTQAAYKLAEPSLFAAGGLALPQAELIKESTLAALAESAGELSMVLPEQKALIEQKKVSATGRLALICAAAAVLIAGLIFDERDEAGRNASMVQQNYERQKKTVADSVSRFTAKLAENAASSVILANAFEPAQSASDVIAAAARCLPASAWLSGISYERGRRLQLKGTAMDLNGVHSYVAAMAAEKRFRDVQLVFANNVKVEDTPVVQFSITAHVVGNMPLDDKNLIKPKAAAKKPVARKS